MKLYTEQQLIPIDAHSFEVFAIKDCEESPTGKQAFIGFKISNGDFHFIGVPYTEPKRTRQMSIKELKNKAEQSWVECDGCNQDDRQMWINGYLAGALSNQIELPSDEEIEKAYEFSGPWTAKEIMQKSTSFHDGVRWVIEKLKQQDKQMIDRAHHAITRIKGKDYAPNVHEIQEWIDKQQDTEDELYSAIEAAIIRWNLDGTKTAGELTREIMLIIKQQNK
jgi:hypothetical protein